ncbi:MAG: TRAP transporter large permease [Deltaproteobacteria bacterium]|nr:TRAP transporter large permease [Deltaproteobacteria bacterium]MBW2218973.1 TRAP transporter large permease [Deltaproteobacteria bacterium]
MTLFIVAVITLMAVLGAPIFIVISSFAMLGFYLADIPIAVIIVDIYNKFSNTPLLYTIPLFTFAGYILAESKTSVRIVNFSRAVLGWLPGGLAIVSLAVCAFFTAFTGASGVTIIALGGLLYPALIKEKYPEKFSLGLLTSSGSLGLLFPPSLPIILYGVVSGTSINQLFAAGLIPGILLILLLSIYSIVTAKKQKAVKRRFSFKEVLKATYETKWELLIPFIIIIGIYGGFVTLGEIATITIVYALFIEVFIYRDIRITEIPDIMTRSMILVGGILIILGSAYGLTNYIVDARVPMVILDFMKEYISSRFVFLIMLNVFLLVVGCVLDIYSALLVVVPLILPIAISYNVNPVHLGIIFLTNLEIGYSTPPVGMNLFISCFRFKKPVTTLYRASIPFLIILFAGLMIITYVPELSLGLVEYFEIK